MWGFLRAWFTRVSEVMWLRDRVATLEHQNRRLAGSVQHYRSEAAQASSKAVAFDRVRDQRDRALRALAELEPVVTGEGGDR